MPHALRIQTLEIGYEEFGSCRGPPLILLHGWPSDPHDWDAVATGLAEEGFRVLCRGCAACGPTRFLDRDTPRSGQPAALGNERTRRSSRYSRDLRPGSDCAFSG
jgi:pimeloyl-ACP methyl ester carboxylesterase